MNYGKTIGFACRTKERKEGIGDGLLKQKVHWNKLRAGSVVAFHWLNWDCLSLAGPLLGEEKIFLSPAGVVKCKFFSRWEFKVSLFLVGLPLTSTSREGAPPLDSHLHLK